MTETKRYKIKKAIRLFVFITGILFVIASWFIENAKEHTVIVNFLVPGYIPAKEAFVQLDQNEQVTVPVTSKEGRALLSFWPKEIPDTPDDLPLKSIGRTGVVSLLSGKGGTFYGLRLRVGDDESRFIAGLEWRNTDAQELLEQTLGERIFHWKIAMFFIGISVSFITGLIEFFRKK